MIRLDDGRRIEGSVDAGFGGVCDAFVENFVERRDLGAACAVYVDGRCVVDLWGGIADARSARSWERDTAAVIFSCSKGLMAMVVYRLVEAGLLDLDAPIGAYWPEFAANGKDGITVRDALSHRAGLASLEVDLTVDDVVAWDPVVHAIERQRPAHRPEDGHVYHPMTVGWIAGEVVHRITGVRPGAWFHDTIARPLGLRLWIGLPPARRATVAWMEAPLPDDGSDAAREVARVLAERPEVARAATMGGAYAFPNDGTFVTFNDPVLQAAEVPAANGIGTAASLAKAYAACVGDVDGTRLLSAESVDDALVVRAAGPQLSGLPDDGARWGTGFQLASPPSQPMLGAGSFGHAGAGGQLAFGDAAHRIGFAYLSNQMGGYGDGRARTLTRALADAIGA